MAWAVLIGAASRRGPHLPLLHADWKKVFGMAYGEKLASCRVHQASCSSVASTVGELVVPAPEFVFFVPAEVSDVIQHLGVLILIQLSDPLHHSLCMWIDIDVG